MSLFDPRPYRANIEEVIRARQQIEQHREEQSLAEFIKSNVRFVHDPYWRSRFWSIQNVRDVVEGKKHHWFWTPFKGVNWAAQTAFIMMPALVAMRGANIVITWWSLLLIFIGAELFLTAIQIGWDAVYWWRFEKARPK